MSDSEAVEEAIELRGELEVASAAMQTVIVKLTKFIEGEITGEEYIEWSDNHDEMFGVAEF